MKLVVGLGNPGPKYELTRHNAGFLMLDQIAEHFGISWSGEKFGGEFGKGQIFGEAVVCLKPLTFMNLSGRSVVQALQFFKLAPGDLIVLHDDIDMETGKVKARVGGGHGGHNGIRSIMADLGNGDFHRIKLGVGRPIHERQQVTDWVLGPFSDDELQVLQKGMFEAVLLRLRNVWQGTSQD